MEEKKEVTYMNYYQYNTPENAFEFLDAQFRQAQNDGYRMLYDITKGICSIFMDENDKKQWDEFSEELRLRNQEVEYNLAKYKAGNGEIKNFALDFLGMGVRNFTSPFDFVTGKINLANKAVDVGVGIALNIGQYIYDQYSLYKRNVFTDFNTNDAANMALSGAVTLGFAALNSKNPKVEGGELLYKDNLKGAKNIETRIDKMTDTQRQILELLNSYGIYEDDKTIMKNISEVGELMNKIYDLAPGTQELKDVTKRLKELDPYVRLISEHKEFIGLSEKVEKFKRGNVLSPKEFFDGYTEIKTNYRDYNQDRLQTVADNILNDLGINPNEVSNIRVRATTDRAKYNSTTGLNNYGEVIYQRNKYQKLGEDIRLTYEKDGDVFLVKSYIDENPEMNVDNHKVYRLGDTSPLDKMTDSSFSEETKALKKIRRMGYSHFVDMKNYNEFLQRKRYARPQDNYVNSVVADYNNAVAYLNEVSGKYKNEISNNYNATGIRDTNIDTRYNVVDSLQPMYKNMKMNLEQQMADDAQELFQTTGVVKAFGNYLYDFINEELGMTKEVFVNTLQTKIFQGKNSKFLTTINNKINLYIQNRSGSSKNVDIQGAYYLDLMFDKQKTMINVKNALDDGINGDFRKIEELKKIVGKKVLLTEKEATAVGLSWDNGKNSIASKLEFDGKYQDVELKEYSIDNNPLEITKALWYGLESSTQDAKKRSDNTWKYQTTYQVGKRFANNGEYENFAQLFRGNEREIYEIVSEVYSTNAKYAIGLDKLEDIIENLRVDSREFNDTISYKNIPGLKTMDGIYRNEAIQQLEGMRKLIDVDSRYKPNFTTDPETLRINNGAIRRSIKSYMGYKFLGNLNFIREFPMNSLKNVYGARKLGWTGRYNFIKATVIDPIKVSYDLFAHCKKAKKGLLNTIKDPVQRRRVELFLQTRVANDPIYNNPKNFSNGLMKTVDKLGNTLAVGQTVSDIHRKVNAEYMSINFMKDVLPNLTEMTSTLKSVLKANGIDDIEMDNLRTRLKSMTDNDLIDLVWSGKRATSDVDYKIQSLFEQFSDIMGREFQAFKDMKPTGETLKSGIVEDMLYLYKRYSLGALDNFIRNLTTYRDVEGIVRSRFNNIGDSDWTTRIKSTFNGTNIENVLDFGQAAIGTSLLYTGIKWTHGKISGSTEDERAEAKFEALFKEKAIVSLAWDSVVDFVQDYTGIGIVLGSKTVIGGFKDSTLSRFKRAWGDVENPLSKGERILWWTTAAFFTPESISRGIDNIKLNKSIPTRITSSSEDENRLWNNKYSVLAEIDQLERELPIEKSFGKIVDWVDYYTKNPDKAYEVTNSPKTTDKDAVIAGASALTETIEEYSELASLEEIMRVPDPLLKNKQLKILGLDIGSQMKQMQAKERRTLNAILSFKGITDEREIITIMHQLNHSDNKKEFLKDMLATEEMAAFKIFQERIYRNRKNIERNVKQIKRNNFEEYLLFLDMLRK